MFPIANWTDQAVGQLKGLNVFPLSLMVDSSARTFSIAFLRIVFARYKRPIRLFFYKLRFNDISNFL